MANLIAENPSLAPKTASERLMPFAVGGLALLVFVSWALNTHAGQNAYFLYNTRCTYRLANSDIDNMLRFSFDGTLLTDRSDCKADHADLNVVLTAETCGGVPPAALDWLRGIIKRAVLIEFDRFIADGQLAERVKQLGSVDSITDVAGFAGMNV